jgi:chromatin structure-remodeling complex subunit SFH1
MAPNSLQSSYSSYAPRLRTYNNALLAPVLASAVPVNPLGRTTKRGTQVINYAEDGFEDYELEEDSDSRRRPTGLRSLRREDSATKVDPGEKAGKETSEPVEVQGIWRDWMIKARPHRSDLQKYAQASLPLTLIPIRIDIDVPSFVPHAPMPMQHPGMDITNPIYRPGEPTVPYRLRDIFLWNLHETLMTTDHFAQILVQDLDLPNRAQMIADISKQIRTQLEEYAGVALHPLFHSQHHEAAAAPGDPRRPVAREDSGTPLPGATSRGDTPLRLANLPSTPSRLRESSPAREGRRAAPDVTATATPIPGDSDEFNPDDTYRCIVNMSINLSSHLYTDKFEWSLLHPPGTAEAFAKQTCADLGLAGEWVPAMTHAIYEAVLRLKKEACEAGGLIGGLDIPNDAAVSANGEIGGWRYEPEHLADDWEPKIETLSKEEMEKREGDRERQVRRLRRETARFSSSAGMAGGVPLGFGFSGLIEEEQERMGRGERSKKKKRFRSLSPLRAATPGLGRYTPDVGGYGGGGSLTEQERLTWRCSHCNIWGSSVWAVRDGPRGPKVSCPVFRSACSGTSLTASTDALQQLWFHV